MKFVPKPLLKTADASRSKASPEEILKNGIWAILFFVGLYLLLGAAAAMLARVIPDGWERSLATATTQGSSSNDTDLGRAEAIFEKLTAGESLRDLNYAFFLFDFGEPNAIAVPGGGIGLTPSLLKEITGDIGLAFIIAHELGHHQGRDLLQSMGRGLLFSLAAALLFGYQGMSPIEAALETAHAGYSRSQEREADIFAMRMMHKAYGRTDGALEFFETFQKGGNGKEASWQKYFGSHPLTEERIRYLSERARQLKAGGR